MPKDTTTKQERILIALEYACLLYYEWNSGKKKKLDNFYEFLNLFDAMVRQEKEKIPDPQNLERNYRNYLSDLEANYDITVSLKKKSIEYNSSNSLEETSLEVLSFYIKHSFQGQNEIHNDSSIQKFLRYRLMLITKKEEGFLMELLYSFVFIRYAIKHKLKLECNYKKLMSTEVSVRRLYPLHLSTDAQYLTLIANDTKDNLRKQFILANLELKSNYSLLNEFRKNQKKTEKFNFKKFKESSEGRFQREEVKFKIRISNFSLEHLLLNYDFPVKILEDKGIWKIIEIISTDELELQKALFGYDTFAQIIEPKGAVKRYKEKLTRILKEY